MRRRSSRSHRASEAYRIDGVRARGRSICWGRVEPRCGLRRPVVDRRRRRLCAAVRSRSRRNDRRKLRRTSGATNASTRLTGGSAQAKSTHVSATSNSPGAPSAPWTSSAPRGVDRPRTERPGLSGPTIRATAGVVPRGEVRTRGFASYWLADTTVGAAFGLSFWEGPSEISDSIRSSHRRRRRFESVLGCTVEGVQEYEAAGRGIRGRCGPGCPNGVQRPASWVPRRRCHSTSSAPRSAGPRGALPAVSGERTDQVVVVLDGQVAVVDPSGLCRLAPGVHFGGARILERRTHAHTVMATTQVRLGVISRSESPTSHVDPRRASPSAITRR